mmetsp:Transcript_15529/g.31494  ORF Transcript_15529/g.31494 Transcript_15529/m.31494 type:complete len:366 (+) Transcript_15529:175-1272(+)
MGDHEDAAASLPTITEEDGSLSGSLRSVSSQNGPSHPEDSAREDDDSALSNKKGKKKKKKKSRESNGVHFAQEDHDTAQQILVDLCNEMKELKRSMQQDAETSNSAMIENIESNRKVVETLTEQLLLLQENMKQLDVTIESKATPEQIEELARIRAVQEMLRVSAEDKDKTVEIYESHAKRGYEEIERLRHDLTAERKEVAALRQEIAILRAQKIEMIKNAAAQGGTTGPIHSRKTLGGTSTTDGASAMSDFDDEMTLNTKESYDTVNYEMKSLKKRIIHMKKKLAVAQMEAKEAGDLRAEVEALRVKCETERKNSVAKDQKIKQLETQLQALRIQKGANPSNVTASQQSQQKHHKKAGKWWQNL